MRPTIHPYLCLEFTHQKTGVCFNDKYYSDDLTRRESDVRINSTLRSWAAAHWPSAAGGWTAALFGAGIRYYDNFHPVPGVCLYRLLHQRSLLDAGMSQGTAMAFLITGAGTSIGAIVGALTIARWKVVGLVVAVPWIGAMAAGFAFDLLWGAGAF